MEKSKAKRTGALMRQHRKIISYFRPTQKLQAIPEELVTVEKKEGDAQEGEGTAQAMDVPT